MGLWQPLTAVGPQGAVKRESLPDVGNCAPNSPSNTENIYRERQRQPLGKTKTLQRLQEDNRLETQAADHEL